MKMIPMNLAQQRMQNQRIAPVVFDQPDAVVRWLGAMQAQDYGQAVWGIGVRLTTSTLTCVEQAIAEAKIIRTWPMRGTIHFVPSEDAKWMLTLGAARMISKDKRRLEQLALTEADLERSKDLMTEALSGRKRLIRSALLQVLEDHGITTQGGRGYHILWNIAQVGHICIGPMEGKEQTFVLLDEWVPNPRILSRDEALAELARRYFISHGPATIHDFVWWSGLTVGEARIGLAAAKTLLTATTLDGKEYWQADEAPTTSAQLTGVWLLPGYDEYLLGYADRSAALKPEDADRVCPGGNGVFYPMIVIDGQIVGTWKRTFKKDKVIFSRALFSRFSKAQDSALNQAAHNYGAFHGLKVVFE
jgi:Winged helix DNA-binding domain